MDRWVKEHRAQRLKIHARVHAAFATTLYAAKLVEIWAEALRTSEAALAVARARLDAGDALPDEVARSETERVRVRLEWECARSLYELALSALATAMGESRLRIESVEGTLEEALEVPALEEILARLDDSPPLAAAAAEVAVARARIDLARARRMTWSSCNGHSS